MDNKKIRDISTGVICVFAILAAMYLIVLIARIVKENNRLEVLAEKQWCINFSGGKVTEYHGWSNSWTCDRMEKFK